MRARLVAAGVVALVVVGGGAYAAGHTTGMHDGRTAGRSQALAGLNPGDLLLVRQLGADQALAAASSPSPAAPAPRACATAGNVMSKSAGCGDDVLRRPSATAAPAADLTAMSAGETYLSWLEAHPDASQPALLTRLVAAKASLPAGAVVTGLAGPAGGSDSDGLVQVGVGGDAACVDATLDQVTAGACYVKGQRENTEGGDYSPKRYPPAYRAAE